MEVLLVALVVSVRWETRVVVATVPEDNTVYSQVGLLVQGRVPLPVDIE